jgi:saccharopine dehydrogenase-like NADP-dependent oxidoreductase
MKILVLGIGLQGRAALHDLARSAAVTHVIAADSNMAGLKSYLERLNTTKIEPVALDIHDQDAVAQVMRRVDAVINLVPVFFQASVTRLAVANDVHIVDTSYASPEMYAIGEQAAAKNLAVLPECGFDPGIDLILAGQAARELDEVQEYYSYGTGFPVPEVAKTNPLQYKISWSVPGLLLAYKRDGRILRDGQIVEIPGKEMFAPSNIHTLDLPGWGLQEAYVNGDAIQFLDKMGIRATVRNAGRFATRWPGHCAFWYTMAQLGFLEDTPVAAGDVRVAPRAVVRALLEQPQFQYADDEQDVAFIRVDMRGLKNGQRRRIVYDMSDVRDLETGLMGMNRSVGYSASIGAQMILRGDITQRGLLSPLTDVPVSLFLQELQARGITVKRYEEDW